MTHMHALVPDDREVSLSAVDQYMRQMRAIPFLTDEEEAVLFAALLRGRVERGQTVPDARVLAEAVRARDRLIEGYQPVIARYASRLVLRLRHLDYLDVVQAGNVALLEALEQCDARVACSFGGFVTTKVWYGMVRAFTDANSFIRLTQRVRREVGQVWNVQNALRERLGRESTVEEQAAALGVSRERVCELLEAHQRGRVESMQALLYEDQDEDEVAWTSAFAPARRETHERAEQVREAVAQLPASQRLLITMRFGLGEDSDEEASMPEVAARLGRPLRSMHGSEATAFRNLRRMLAETCGMARERAGEVGSEIVCQWCGDAFPAPKFGAAPRYCCNACQVAAKRARVHQGERTAQTPREYYTVGQVVERAGVTRQTVYNWVMQGKLRRYPAPVGLGASGGGRAPQLVYDREEVEAFLQSQEEVA